MDENTKKFLDKCKKNSEASKAATELADDSISPISVLDIEDIISYGACSPSPCSDPTYSTTANAVGLGASAASAA